MQPKSSHRYVYSLVKNVLWRAMSERSTKSMDRILETDMPDYVWRQMIKRNAYIRALVQTGVTSVFSAIESGQFTYPQLARTCLYIVFMAPGKMTLSRAFKLLTSENVSNINKLFGKARRTYDEALVAEMLGKLKLSLEDLFAVGIEGESIAYRLVKTGQISPAFVVNNMEVLQKQKHHYKQTEHHMLFVRTCTLIAQLQTKE